MNLANEREQKKITQQELANKVGVTRQMISAIEKGARPSVKTAQKIANALSFDWTRFYEEKDAG